VTEREAADLEITTRGQYKSPSWREERSKRLTASNFGSIMKMREKTSVKSRVFSILYGHAGGPAIKHGRKYEETALKDFEEQTKKSVRECGLFVDVDHPYLAASPGK
jgi:predicted phage-related endonuclease